MSAPCFSTLLCLPALPRTCARPWANCHLPVRDAVHVHRRMSCSITHADGATARRLASDSRQIDLVSGPPALGLACSNSTQQTLIQPLAAFVRHEGNEHSS
ncbi:hypothetical protein K458DRAFT_101012 [Lentithecium fluviatile CBS 122367]|uniref:Secreted protein n=1 Tax=Lentithecium fluviatile CBS 122367 TaxID=1168545 RepID=A0A6G1JIA7_9PLEO|nr:hypothetical protein K458DRAFT_101012 [Lentithecium fluviatile CBS 122367]